MDRNRLGRNDLGFPENRRTALGLVGALLLLLPGSGVLPGIARADAPAAAAADAPSQSQAESLGAVVGVPWSGGAGITETVEQIMARQKAQELSGKWRGREQESDRGWRNNNPNRRPNPDAPAVSAWPAADKTVDDAASLLFSPQVVGTTFQTMHVADTPGYTPPDTMGDVGPTQILSISNGRIRVFNKTGALGGLNADEDTFFFSVGGATGVTDAHIRYDRLTQRWFIVCVNLDAVNKVLIAVSSGPTITNSASFTFYQFRHDLVGTTPNTDTNGFLDYPTLGVDKFALYIGGDVINSAGTALVGTTGFVVNKANLIAGSLTVTAFRQLAAGGAGAGPESPQGVDNDDPGATEGYFAGPDLATFGTIMFRRVSTPGGTPSISANIAVTVPATYFPLANGQPARGSTTLDGIDDRFFAAAIHKNKITGVSSLWAAHNMRVSTTGVASSTGTRNGSRWYEFGNLTTTPALVQSGTLFDAAASNPRGYWVPSVIASGQGHMALGCSYANATVDFAGAAASGRLRTDTAGTIQAPTLAQVSATAYTFEGGANQRWGDYSQTDVDPNDDMTIWTFQEYCDTTNSWAIRAIQLKAPPPALPTSATGACTGQAAASTTITGTSSAGSEFFDPGSDAGGPGFANHIAAAVTGGATVNSVTFTDPTHVTLSLNTIGAVPGAQNVTITNPDGQSAIGSSILTLSSAPVAPTATNGGTVCAGATLQLFASTIAGATYAWTGPNGFTSAVQNPTIPGATTAATGTYTVKASVGGCQGPGGTTSVTVTPDGGSCSDGNACTVADTCQAGACASGAPVTCTASDACHVAGICNPGTGVCSNPAATNGSPCSDGNACTQSDSCQAGLCTGSNPVTCTASDPCHVAGACSPGTGLCSNPAASDGTPCSDGNGCTQSDSCQAGLCTGSNPVTCTASDQCHVAGACSPGTGLCSNPAASDGTPCSDGDACTANDACSAGACGGAPLLVPSEVADLGFTDATTLVWTSAGSAGPGTVHDVPRGLVSQLPVGSGAAEVCIASGPAATATDTATPGAGEAFWYLVRGRNACGTGSYGTDSLGGPRVTGVCP